MNLAKFSGSLSWETEQGTHTPSGSRTPIAICGWLLKMKRTQRKFMSTWSKRWFTVEDGSLHWFKGPSSVTCNGSLPLKDILSVRKFEGGTQGSFSFVVNTEGRNLLLRADTAKDVGRWLRGLTLQIDLISGGTSQGPPCTKNMRKPSRSNSSRSILTHCIKASPTPSEGLTEVASTRSSRSSQSLSYYKDVNERIREIMDAEDEMDNTNQRCNISRGSGCAGADAPSSSLGAVQSHELGAEANVFVSPVETFDQSPCLSSQFDAYSGSDSDDSQHYRSRGRIASSNQRSRHQECPARHAGVRHILDIDSDHTRDDDHDGHWLNHSRVRSRGNGNFKASNAWSTTTRSSPGARPRTEGRERGSERVRKCSERQRGRVATPATHGWSDLSNISNSENALGGWSQECPEDSSSREFEAKDSRKLSDSITHKMGAHIGDGGAATGSSSSSSISSSKRRVISPARGQHGSEW
ncbi:unnamed protein product [Chrysoparadoxa australica]